ncbi:hypothetical protein BGX38DRAFT_1163626 [Terfezia claveryi]|nr:hypothetical protein BGX38DRAFT_1163626 [Terfezia claveryi]
MAAPATIDISNISGVWIMKKKNPKLQRNKILSDDTADVLAAQSIGWFLRNSIGLATITLTIKHTTDPETGVEQIDINQSLSGLSGTVEARKLDWTDRPHEDYVCGKVVGKSRRAQLSQIDDELLKKGWTDDTVAKGFIQSYVIWGFMEVNGERRYARRVKLMTPNLRLDKVLVYDYQA